MGFMLQPICDCGAQFKIVLMGGGMQTFMEEFIVPYYCDKCSLITPRNLLRKEQKCSKCKRHLVMYGKLGDTASTNDQDISKQPENIVFDSTISSDWQYLLEDINHHCPKCKKETLRFLSCGNWD